MTEFGFRRAHLLKLHCDPVVWGLRFRRVRDSETMFGRSGMTHLRRLSAILARLSASLSAAFRNLARLSATNLTKWTTLCRATCHNVGGATLQSRLSKKGAYPPPHAPLARLSAFLARLSAFWRGFPHLSAAFRILIQSWCSGGIPHKNIIGKQTPRRLGF